MSTLSRISVPTPTSPIAAELAVPDGSGPWPGVVVVHDALGPSDDLHDSAKRFSDNGFLVLAFGYDAAATADAYRRVFAFFGEYLTVAP